MTDARGASVPGTVTVSVMGPESLAPDFVEIKADTTSVTLRLRGSPGQVYHLEASTDLLHWVKLGTVTAASTGLGEFTDRDKNLYPRRCYRATR